MIELTKMVHVFAPSVPFDCRQSLQANCYNKYIAFSEAVVPFLQPKPREFKTSLPK